MGGRRGEGEVYEKNNMDVSLIICKIDSQLWIRKLKQGLCINLEGRDGVNKRWEVQKGGDTLYTYGQFMLKFDRKQQNSVKQLSFN